MLKSDKQESVSLQLAYLSFRIDMRFYEDKDSGQILVRSIKGEKKLEDFTSIHQINEIVEKAAHMKSNLQNQLDMA